MYEKIKSVQSTLSHLQSPPEQMQSQLHYGSFLLKSHLHGMILLTMPAQNRSESLVEQFAISRSSISNMGKQYVCDHVAGVNIESSYALKEKKA